MSNDPSLSAGAERVELRRDVTIWSSYTWGYADVGADIYVAKKVIESSQHVDLTALNEAMAEEGEGEEGEKKKRDK